jgi:hypothetical protein
MSNEEKKDGESGRVFVAAPERQGLKQNFSGRRASRHLFGGFFFGVNDQFSVKTTANALGSNPVLLFESQVNDPPVMGV